jgi:hypothetical protein
MATKWLLRSYIPLILIIAFVCLFIFVSLRYIAQARRYDDRLIADNIEKLAQIFKSIHACCKIIGFEHKRNYIDFLTVEKFEGNRVGAMTLEHPENWQGPYLYQPMLSDGKEYEILHTKQGYYIVPGMGVRLSNEKTIGKDILVNPDTDIEVFIQSPQSISNQRRPLAVRIEVASGYQDIVPETTAPDQTIDTDYS